jgi:DNA-binding XRE family transcriptional regulator
MQKDLAERAGISVTTLVAIEKGSARAAIGTVFELAALLGIPLVGANDAEGREVIDTRMALLPARVDVPRKEVDDDF